MCKSPGAGKRLALKGREKAREQGGKRTKGDWSEKGPDQAWLAGWREVMAASWRHWGVMAGLRVGSYGIWAVDGKMSTQ